MPDPQVGFEMSSLFVSEGAASVEVIITASGATFVEMYMEDGTAQGIGNRTGCRNDGCSTPTLPPSTAGFDYNSTTQLFNFSSSSSRKTSIAILDDAVHEGDEYFTAHLRGTTLGGVELTQDTLNITLQEDDSEMKLY